jgi:hypothetical protein
MSDQERARELFERRYYASPDSGIISDAINHAAIELLKSDPDEYFRLSRIWRRMQDTA